MNLLSLSCRDLNHRPFQGQLYKSMHYQVSYQGQARPFPFSLILMWKGENEAKKKNKQEKNISISKYGAHRPFASGNIPKLWLLS